EVWHPSHSCRSLIACHIRLHSLWERYCDIERLARRRAEKLLREADRANPYDFNTARFADLTDAGPHGACLAVAERRRKQHGASHAPVEPCGLAASGLAFACTDLRARAPP